MRGTYGRRYKNMHTHIEACSRAHKASVHGYVYTDAHVYTKRIAVHAHTGACTNTRVCKHRHTRTRTHIYRDAHNEHRHTYRGLHIPQI